MKYLAWLGISLALVCAMMVVRVVRTAGVVAQSRNSIRGGGSHHREHPHGHHIGSDDVPGVVQAYIDRAKAYNGVCTALLTSDGADVAPAADMFEPAPR
jgi:hypothetical protein